MVCLGNICRSPLAEGILKSKLNNSFEIDSAGTGGWHAGEKPDHRSIKTAKDFGVDISTQRGRQIKTSDLDYFDIIFVMDESNYTNVITLCKSESQKQKVKLILREANLSETNVPDPYYGDATDFIHVYNLLDNACNIIAEKLTNEQ